MGGIRTDNAEDQAADDKEGRPADTHPTGEVEEGGKKQGGPEEEVEQRPQPTGGLDRGTGETALLVVVLLQCILQKEKGRKRERCQYLISGESH